MRTYGWYAFAAADREIRLKMEPMAATRFKRVFERANKAAIDFLTIGASPENARELEWFMDRYPLTPRKPRDAKRLDDLARKFDRMMNAVAEITAPNYEPPSVDLALPARHYQLLPAAMLETTGGVLVGDEVGLGKTVEAIVALVKPKGLPALVVTKTDLPVQWQREIQRFAPGLSTYVLQRASAFVRSKSTYAAQDLAATVKQGQPLPDVVITSYSKLQGWADWIVHTFRPQTVIWDEVQEVRRGFKTADKQPNYRNLAMKAIAEATPRRLGLSVGPESILEIAGGLSSDGWIGHIEMLWHTCESIVGRDQVRVTNDGYEILDVSSTGICARGWDGLNKRFIWKPIKNVIRHRCDRTARVLQAGGNADGLTVTDDHSVFRATPDGSAIECVQASEIREGDIIPSDDGNNWIIGPEEMIDVTAICDLGPNTQVVVDLSGHSAQTLGVPSWAFNNFQREAQHGDRLPLALYRENRARLPKPTRVYYAKTKGDSYLPARVRISDWAYILGFFLGDGWISDRSRVCFAVDNPRVEAFIEELRALPGVGIDPKVRAMRGQSSEVRCSNMLIARVFERFFPVGVKCHEKRIPASWILTWPEEARLNLLRGLIDSDGHVSARASRLYYTTTSKALAESLMSLLRSLGIKGSCSTRFSPNGGTVDGRQIIGKRLTYSVNWSWHAMHGENDGHKGLRRRHACSKDSFNEAVVRKISLCDSAPEYVYDLEMDGHPSFVANGLLVHNSATPIHNEGSEIHNVMAVILPDALGNMGEFKREWCASGGNVKEPKALGSYLRERGLFIRRTKKEVGRELPDLTISEQYCETDAHAIEALKTSSRAIELAQMILSGKREERFTAQGEFDMFVRQQTGLAKAPYVAAFVKMLLESEKPIVLAGWHHAVYDLWAELLKDYHPAFFTGRETIKEKQESVRRFCTGETKLFIMSLRSGAGLDGLQYAGCSDVVFGELDWTPAVHEQFIGRVRRDGNDTPVTAWYLVADEGSDPEMASTLGIKRAQLDGIRDPKGDVLAGTVDRDAVKRLAAAFLKDAGKAVPESTPKREPAPLIARPTSATPRTPSEITLFESNEGAA